MGAHDDWMAYGHIQIRCPPGVVVNPRWHRPLLMYSNIVISWVQLKTLDPQTMDSQPYCIVCFAYHQLPDCLQFEPSSIGSALERYLPDTFLIGVNSGMYTCGLRNTSRQVNSSATGKQRIGNCSVARCELLRLLWQAAFGL